MPNEIRVADDLKTGIHDVVVEIHGKDNPRNRCQIYRQFELPEDQRLKGLLKLSERTVAWIPSIVRADLLRRAGVTTTKANSAAPL